MQEVDLIISCFNPSVASIAKSNMEYLRSKYFGYTEFEKLLKLIDEKFDLISQGNYTETTFQNDLISLSYTPDMIQVMDQAFQKMQNYTEDELHAVRNALSNVITNEAINKCKRENYSSPIDFVRALQGFNVDNIQDVDKRIYRESKFTEIDIAKLEEEVTGNTLKSSMNMINYCSPLGGYIDRTLTMVSGKPGCFTGDTKVMVVDGTYKTMQELYDSKAQNIPVYSLNEETGDIVIVSAKECRLTKQVDKIARVTLDNGYVIECTPDHLFRTVNQFYVPACELSTGVALMPIHKSDVCESYENHKVLSVEIISLQAPINVFDLIDAGPYHNFAIKVDYAQAHHDSGVFVHNSGKSLFLIQEACEFCKQGKKVLYLALGDMNEFHFVTRILAQQYRMSMTRVATTFRTVYTQAMNDPEMKWLDNLLIQYFTPDQISCTNWISFIKSKGYYDEYDVFIADYDSNFASEEEMYQKGETTYNQLKSLSDRPGKWVFVACQPKPNYYSEEILPLESGNESSRKQQIVDNMITISFPPFKGGQNHIGIINVPKYRGGMLASTHYLMDKNGRFEEISRDLYEWLKNCLYPVTLPGSGCSDSNKEVDLSNIPLLKAK